MVALKEEASRKHVADLMAVGYSIPAGESAGEAGDAHSTNMGRELPFFPQPNNPTNFERVWNNAYRLYRGNPHDHAPAGAVDDQVMDFSIIEKLGKERAGTPHRRTVSHSICAGAASKIEVENEIFTNTVYIHFYPNSWNLREKITRKVDGKEVEELYDPNVDNVLEEIASWPASLARPAWVDRRSRGQFQEGRGRRRAGAGSGVKKLSERRATRSKQALVESSNLIPISFRSAQRVGCAGGPERSAEPGQETDESR